MAKVILIIEDEQTIVDILKFHLEREGFVCHGAGNGLKGLRMAAELNPDLILLDIMLPGIDGLEVCKRIRAQGSQTPVIMLTAREEEEDKVFGLELGADDYVTKPFAMKELIARIKANMRRSAAGTGTGGENALRYGGLTIDFNSMDVKKDGKSLELSQKEFDLLVFMAKQPNQVFSRDELMENVWNYEYYGDARTVDVTVRRLREKLEDNPAEPGYIMTRRGAGYFFSINN
ncbi:MAG: response regulator transcription factor [Oscillospiraceae bacterium]|nr:response regulator transcription factor [Oscillospiraceae bacterium]